MSRIGILALCVAALTNCTSAPVGPNVEDNEQNEKINSSETSSPICAANNTSPDCTLLLTTIEYEMPDENCQVYDLLIEVETEFKAPAGLGNGSTTRIDWEFLPNGNAGFWISNIDAIVPADSQGSIEMLGCFTFGSQETLRITRTIEDEFGHESNPLTVEIQNPVQGKIVSNTKAGFEFQSNFITTH